MEQMCKSQPMKERSTLMNDDMNLIVQVPPKFLSAPWPWDDDLALPTVQISRGFTSRGDAFMAKGLYHLAISDYGEALNHRPYALHSREYDPVASANRREALNILHHYFDCGGDPTRLPPEIPEATREAVRKAKVPRGYLVVGHGNILGTAPFTPEGRQLAIDYADKVASDGQLRSRLDNAYLTESDEFDAVVYEHDTLAKEIYRAQPQLKGPEST